MNNNNESTTDKKGANEYRLSTINLVKKMIDYDDKLSHDALFGTRWSNYMAEREYLRIWYLFDAPDGSLDIFALKKKGGLAVISRDTIDKSPLLKNFDKIEINDGFFPHACGDDIHHFDVVTCEVRLDWVDVCNNNGSKCSDATNLSDNILIDKIRGSLRVQCSTMSNVLTFMYLASAVLKGYMSIKTAKEMETPLLKKIRKEYNMGSGKVYRNKPILHNMQHTRREFEQPLHKFMIDYLNINHDQEENRSIYYGGNVYDGGGGENKHNTKLSESIVIIDNISSLLSLLPSE